MIVNDKNTDILNNNKRDENPFIVENQKLNDNNKEKYLPEVIQEVDDSKNEISMIFSNNKLNNPNNITIDLKRIEFNNKVNSKNDINYNANNTIIYTNSDINQNIDKMKLSNSNNINTNIITTNQKKFVVKENYFGMERMRNASKEKIDLLKKNLSPRNDESIKSHNLLTFFKTIENKDNECKIMKSNFIIDDSKKFNKDNIVVNHYDSKLKNKSIDNKNNNTKNKDANFSSNETMIKKFLLGKILFY